jgi:hypothetical protein
VQRTAAFVLRERYTPVPQHWVPTETTAARKRPRSRADEMRFLWKRDDDVLSRVTKSAGRIKTQRSGCAAPGNYSGRAGIWFVGLILLSRKSFRVRRVGLLRRS